LGELKARQNKAVEAEHRSVLDQHSKAREALATAKSKGCGIQEAEADLAKKRQQFLQQVHCIFQAKDRIEGVPGDSKRLMIYM
jgi:hypothetical protein